MAYTRDELSRMQLAALTEPGDPITGQVLRLIGPAETLELIRNPKLALPSQVDPLAGVRWRQHVTARQSDTLAEQLVADTDRYGLRLLTPGRAGWPAAFADLGDLAPVALWAKGNPELLTSSLSSRVTFTGARAATGYGTHVTTELAGELAGEPRIVVSGGAYGVEAAAHRAALAARDGSTIAVLAGGLDRPYPRAHADLFQRISDSGGIQVSEAAPGVSPTKWRFMARARLLAALGGATIIPEASAHSGSLLVAARAFELGRPVGSVPGPVTSASSAGCHRLLREDFATVITYAGDVRDLLDPPPASMLPEPYQRLSQHLDAEGPPATGKPRAERLGNPELDPGDPPAESGTARTL